MSKEPSNDHHRPVAYKNGRFLDSPDARPLRILSEYLQPYAHFRREKVRDTIVFFGSSRTAEDHSLGRYYREARELARRLTEWSEQLPDTSRRFVVCTGGGPGIMEAANRGAFDCDAKSVGLNISLPYEQFPNPYVSPELCFLFHYFAMRKLHFMSRAKALVAFPGGYGTFDELFEALALIQTRKIKPLPIILVGEEFWRQAFDMDFLVAEGVIDAEDKDLFRFAESAADIWEGILRWYDESGESLFSASRVAQ